MTARIKWLCRRGMKELDLLVDDYYQNIYPDANDTQRAAFEHLLTYQDPIIVDLLFGRIHDDNEEIQALIEFLKTRQTQRS